MSQYRFAELIESVAQATIDCYVGENFNAETVAKIQSDMRNRFKTMFSKIGKPISERATEWLADEHLKLAAVNEKQTISQTGLLVRAVALSELSKDDREMLKKLLPPDISIIGAQLV